MIEPRAYSTEETRAKFLEHVRGLIAYWDALPNTSETRKLQGLAFSILAVLDGESGQLPAFRVTPFVSDGDKEFCQGRGENWYDESVDIAGSLHDELWKPTAE